MFFQLHGKPLHTNNLLLGKAIQFLSILGFMEQCNISWLWAYYTNCLSFFNSQFCYRTNFSRRSRNSVSNGECKKQICLNNAIVAFSAKWYCNAIPPGTSFFIGNFKISFYSYTKLMNSWILHFIITPLKNDELPTIAKWSSHLPHLLSP